MPVNLRINLYLPPNLVFLAYGREHSSKQLNQKLGQLQDQKVDIGSESISLSKQDSVKGATVFIPKLNSQGKIIHPPDKQNKVRVEANGITLILKLSDLQLPQPAEAKNIKTGIPVSVNKSSRLESLQIDLRGKRVDEALMETEKFIDTALMSNIWFVSILHGKGTGALMEAIHNFLKEQSFVTHFQFADEDQGGAGITVVELK